MTTRLAWIAFALVFGAILTSALTFDYRSHPKVVGDQASHLLQALSLDADGDLRFDRGDLARWKALGWEEIPNGLFYRKFEGGLAFAKPYFYSAYLSFLFPVAGPVFGVALGNALALAGVVACSWSVLRRQFSGSAPPLMLLAAFGASNFFHYAFAIEPAPLHALLAAATIALVLRFTDRGDVRALAAAGPVAAVALAEKVSLGLLLGPLLVWALTRKDAPRWRFAGWFSVALCASLLPHLHYSDWSSWLPYGGDRYYCLNTTPFPGPDDPEPRVATPNDAPSGRLMGNLSDPAKIALGAYYAVFGAFTGLFPMAPAVLLLGIGAVYAGRAVRDPFWPLAAGIGLMVIGYLVQFPENYYGGGHAFGNRWFLKLTPSALALAACSRLGSRKAAALAGAALALAVPFLGREHLHHRDTFWAPGAHVSPARRYLPFEGTQVMLPDAVGPAPVNLGLLPAKPRWSYVGRLTPPLQEWIGGRMETVPSTMRGRAAFAQIAQGPIFQTWMECDGATTLLAEGSPLAEGSAFEARDGRCFIAVSSRKPVVLDLRPQRGVGELRVWWGGKEIALALPCRLVLPPQPATLQFLGLRSEKPFLGQIPSENAAALPETALPMLHGGTVEPVFGP